MAHFCNAGGMPHIGDPAILQHEGRYYLYATGGAGEVNVGIPCYESPDLVDWTPRGLALHKDAVWGDHSFWAPDVFHHHGRFYMFYVADQKCFAVATSDHPCGPFVQAERRPFFEHDIAIDPHVHVDSRSGEAFLYFVRCDGTNKIFGAQLTPDLQAAVPGSQRLLLEVSQEWEKAEAHRVNEAPLIIEHPDTGRYYMMYSANHFESPEYGVGYAVADHPLGPFTKAQENPILKSTALLPGAGHHTVTRSPDGTELLIAYHTHNRPGQIHPRKLCVDRLFFRGDALCTSGPSHAAQPPPSGAAEAEPSAELAGGRFLLVACTGLAAAAGADGQLLQQPQNPGDPAQAAELRWSGGGYYELLVGGRHVAAPAGGAGGAVRVGASAGEALWRVHRPEGRAVVVRLQAMDGGNYLSVPSAALCAPCPLVAEPDGGATVFHYAPGQAFRLRSVADGAAPLLRGAGGGGAPEPLLLPNECYCIVSCFGLAVEMQCASCSPDGNVVQWWRNGAPCQEWRAVPAAGGAEGEFALVNAVSGLLLDATPRCGFGERVFQAPGDGRAEQRWRVVPCAEAPKGRIVSAAASGAVLQVASGDAGAHVLARPWSEVPEQFFALALATKR